MRVERQRYYECGLATIASLSDTSLDDVRTFACNFANVDSWGCVFMWDGAKFWDMIGKIAKHYHVTGLPKMLYGKGHNKSRNILKSGQSRNKLLKGRGSVTIRYEDSSILHTMPFEEGLVYDPEQPNKPLPIDALLKDPNRYLGWILVNVTR